MRDERLMGVWTQGDTRVDLVFSPHLWVVAWRFQTLLGCIVHLLFLVGEV